MDDKLTLPEMAYMAGLLTGARVPVSHSITKRLVTLALIEVGDVPIDPAVTAQFDSDVVAWRALVRKAVTQGSGMRLRRAAALFTCGNRTAPSSRRGSF